MGRGRAAVAGSGPDQRSGSVPCNFRRAAKWASVTRKAGFPDPHFHDLRHTGNTLAAGSGASLRDLMERMGHDSVRAAMIYQHSTAEADRKIADVMDSKIASVVPPRRVLTERDHR
ncbi:tyrosine-type recombinase/integrase [Sphaerisporangium aureirubrum]|uniref:Tyrosine-type recombinase/integrase n=1 Tax=Sphaerisporangium aureirubrum TaxID=1544736 RepID=A0ABW1ND13_9ACTN